MGGLRKKFKSSTIRVRTEHVREIVEAVHDLAVRPHK